MKLTDQDAKILLGDVSRASTLVDAGVPINDAVAKCAKDGGWLPGRVRIVCTHLNVGKQAAQRTANLGSEKFEGFEPADPDKVLAIVGGQAKTASVASPASVAPSLDYRLPPSWLAAKPAPSVAKTASAPKAKPVDPLAQLEQMEAKAAKIAAAAAKSREYALNTIVLATGDAVRYFDAPQHRREKFASVEAAAELYWPGRIPSQVFAAVHHAAGLDGRLHREQVKQAEARHDPGSKKANTTLPSSISPDAAPWRSLLAVADAMKDYDQSSLLAKVASDAAAELRQRQLAKIANAGNYARASAKMEPLAIGTPFRTKLAGILSLPAFGAAAGVMLTKSLGMDQPRTSDDLVNKAVSKLRDPDHEDELRSIRTRAMLTRMLTDPDDPISGHDPDEVVNAFNDLSRYAPRVADQQLAAGAFLRKRLDGRAEPFDAKQLVEIDSELGKSYQPQQRAMSNAS